MIAVKENILKAYLKYRVSNDNDFDRDLISNFFQYYKPFKVGFYQLLNLGYSERTALNLYQEQDIFNSLSSSIGIFTNIFCQNDWNDSRTNDLETYNLKWSIVKNEFDFNIHDRYIKTDKVEIILSSGFLNLSNTTKDFTYIVKARSE